MSVLLIDAFGALGWIHAIALTVGFIAPIWATAYLLDQWHKRRHERLSEQAKREHERKQTKMEQEYEITRELNELADDEADDRSTAVPVSTPRAERNGDGGP